VVISSRKDACPLFHVPFFTSVPTFVLLESGTKKAQMIGARSKKDFEKWLSEN